MADYNAARGMIKDWKVFWEKTEPELEQLMAQLSEM